MQVKIHWIVSVKIKLFLKNRLWNIFVAVVIFLFLLAFKRVFRPLYTALTGCKQINNDAHPYNFSAILGELQDPKSSWRQFNN